MIDTSFLFKFIKFCCVGLSGMVIDFGITSLLKEKFKLNKYVSNSIGFILAASSNYCINRYWTFESKNMHMVHEYLSFLLIATIGLVLNNLIIYFFHDRLKLNFYLSKFIGILIVTTWNFGLNYFITFAR